MRPGKEEISSPSLAECQAKRTKRTRWYVALGAIFLFVGFVVGTQVFGDSSELDAHVLLQTPFAQGERGVFSAQVSSSQVLVPEAPELVLLGDTSVVAAVPPMAVTPQVLGAIIGEANSDFRSRREVAHYIVEQGDTVEALAERFEISAHTLLWANELGAGATLTPGEELIVLPVSGALHLVRPNDTLSEIALWYEGDAGEILEFNNLESPEQIFVGDLLIIPGGRKPARVPNGRLTPLANSYFIYPVPRSFKLTQGLHPFNAVDLSNGTCGSPAYAAAGGQVQRVGYNNTAGNYVRVVHPNGVVTFYGHLSGQAVNPGQRVLQGEIVGYIGHSGYTIPAGSGGCHLHFEVRGAANPFVK